MAASAPSCIPDNRHLDEQIGYDAPAKNRQNRTIPVGQIGRSAVCEFRRKFAGPLDDRVASNLECLLADQGTQLRPDLGERLGPMSERAEVGLDHGIAMSLASASPDSTSWTAP